MLRYILLLLLVLSRAYQQRRRVGPSVRVNAAATDGGPRWERSSPKGASSPSFGGGATRARASRGNAGTGRNGKQSLQERERQVRRVLEACKVNKQGDRLASMVVAITEANHAILTAGRLGRISDALTIFEALDEEHLGFSPDLMSYNNIIWVLGNAGQLDAAKRLFNKLTSSTTPPLKPNVYTYGSLMHGCAKAKAYRQALHLLDRMQEEKVTPNQVVFTSAMEACAEAGQHKEAIAVMDRMEKIGMKPDITMVNAAIKACSLAGAMDEADALANSLRAFGSMDVFTYHTLMMGNTKLGRHHRVLSLYDEAIESSATLDGGVYSLAMLSALNCGLYQQVPRIAERARAEKVALTEASYTILMQALADAGACDQAVACLDIMVSEGLQPNVISYAAAMAAAREKPAVVVELLGRMKAQGCEPNTVLLTTAINSLSREGGLYTDMAYSILADMEKNGPEPNIYTYNTVMRAFAEQGRLQEALQVLQSIRRRGLEPDRFTFTTLLMAAGRAPPHNSSSSSASNFASSDQQSPSTVQRDSVSEILQSMKDAGVQPDEIAYGAAIDAHRRNNNSLRAVECLHAMHRSNLEPTAAHYNLVLRTLRAENYIDKMFKMVVAISAKEGARINLNTFEIVIEALLETDKWKEALLIVKTMEKMGFKPTIETYVGLCERLEKAREYKAVLAIYRTMVAQGYDFYENGLLNGIMKRLVNVVGAKDIDINAISVSVPDILQI